MNLEIRQQHTCTQLTLHASTMIQHVNSAFSPGRSVIICSISAQPLHGCSGAAHAATIPRPVYESSSYTSTGEYETFYSRRQERDWKEEHSRAALRLRVGGRSLDPRGKKRTTSLILAHKQTDDRRVYSQPAALLKGLFTAHKPNWTAPSEQPHASQYTRSELTEHYSLFHAHVPLSATEVLLSQDRACGTVYRLLWDRSPATDSLGNIRKLLFGA